MATKRFVNTDDKLPMDSARLMARRIYQHEGCEDALDFASATITAYRVISRDLQRNWDMDPVHAHFIAECAILNSLSRY